MLCPDKSGNFQFVPNTPCDTTLQRSSPKKDKSSYNLFTVHMYVYSYALSLKLYAKKCTYFNAFL